MFSWVNKAAVKSDGGFSVLSLDRFRIEYREGARKLTVYTEPGRTAAGKSCEIIGRNSFRRWDDDAADVTISPEKQQEMLANFTDAMNFQGIEVVVDRKRDENY